MPAAPLSTGHHPGGLFQSAPGDRCFPDKTLTSGTRLPAPIEAQRLHPVAVCFAGFPDNYAVTLHLSGPGGVTRDYRMTVDGLRVVFTLDMPMGDWTARATAEGAATATATMHVGRATTPATYQTSSHGPAGGAGLTIHLAGFAPRSLVNVFLYGPRGSGLSFIRALPVAAVDGHGEARYSVSARGDDLPGKYGIWTDVCGGMDKPVACATYQK